MKNLGWLHDAKQTIIDLKKKLAINNVIVIFCWNILTSCVSSAGASHAQAPWFCVVGGWLRGTRTQGSGTDPGGGCHWSCTESGGASVSPPHPTRSVSAASLATTDNNIQHHSE